MQTYPSVWENNVSEDFLEVIGFILSYANQKGMLKILWKKDKTH